MRCLLALNRHAHIITTQFSHNPKRFYSSLKVFDEMPERNLVSWNLIISGANKNGEYEVGMELFVYLMRNGCFAVNEFALGSVMKACVGMGGVEFGLCVHCFAVKIGLEGNVFVGCSVLPFCTCIASMGVLKKGFVGCKCLREFAKKAIKRYTHYYERWAANEKSRKQALSDLHHKFQPHIQPLTKDYGVPESKFQFITEAWLQIAECRRVLKWIYAYGYYIPIDEAAKKKFFEYRQGEAESALERLHYCAEKELSTYIERQDKEAATAENLHNFSIKLTKLTKTTQKFFKNLVRALENDLSEVDDYDLSLARALENDLSEVNDYHQVDDDELSYQWVFFKD